jgi:hypothetical protein
MATGNHSSVPEGFKEVPGYSGRYFINENGDVWSVVRKRLMSPQTDVTHPYPWVLLTEEDKRQQPRTLYYLIRITWMPPAPGKVGTGRGKWCINHKDGNKLNSSLDNLEWVTNEENLRHAWRTGLRADAIGENAKQAKFSSDEVRQIRLRLLLGEKVKDIAAEYDCNLPTIKKIQWYISWKRQDHDLVEPMIKVCRSKWLRVMKTKIERGEPMEEFCNRNSRGRVLRDGERLAEYGAIESDC